MICGTARSLAFAAWVPSVGLAGMVLFCRSCMSKKSIVPEQSGCAVCCAFREASRCLDVTGYRCKVAGCPSAVLTEDIVGLTLPRRAGVVRERRYVGVHLE